MWRKCLAFMAIAAVMLMCAGAASAKAVKQEVAVDPEGTAKVTLNYCPDELQVIVNVNASGLAAGSTYAVVVLDELGAERAREEFTTKPDKSKGKVNGKGEPKKTKNFKSKGHVNIHIQWDPLAAPPVLTAWTVEISVVVPEVEEGGTE